MSLEIALSFLLYAFVSGITPGPANLCSLSVAMGCGKSVAIKQWYGIAFVGAIYIAYLAISLLIQAFKPLEEIRNSRTTGSFRTGLFVQLTNVKIMVFCLTAITTYMLPYHQDFPHLFFLGLLLPLTGPICNLAWLFTGVLLQGLFKKHHRIFYTLMGLSLLYCAVGIVK